MFNFSKMLIVLLFLSGVIVQAAEIPKGLNQTLKSWQPEISLSDEGVLQVLLNEKEVNEATFNRIIESGICATVWLKQVGGDLEGVKQVHVLNNSLSQGFVFNGGKEACDEMGKMSGDETKKRLKELSFPFGEHPKITEEKIEESKQPEGKFDCSKKNCGEMTSCEEARYKLEKCGDGRLDRNNDGVPCEKICN